MNRFLPVVLLPSLALSPLVAGADAPFTVKEAKSALPAIIGKPVAELLSEKSVQLIDEKGAPVCELWFRKALPSEAAPEQVKNGLTYQELAETTLIGVLQVKQLITDYRNQKIKPGVYTIRLGLQPQDGDHMGTAPYREFCLLMLASDDKDPKPLESAKDLQEFSGKASGTGHPAIFLLFPNNKPTDSPSLVDKGNGHWALSWKEPVQAGEMKASLGFALTVVGHTSAE